LSAYHGDLKADSGIPQSVYQMDKTKMEEFKDADGELFKQMLTPGETMTLPDGAGSVTFEKDVKEWAGFQIVQEPGGGWALGGAVVAIGGLAGSLFIQRRRVWVRAVKGADGLTVVEMGGLGRSESAKVPEELGDLAEILYDRAPGAPGPNDPDDTTQATAAAADPPASRSAAATDLAGAATQLAAATNESLAEMSNVLIYSAMAVYTLAFFAYIAEWIFGSRSKVARTAAALTPKAKKAEGGPAVTVRQGGGT